jgi:hypothetical protein
MLIMNMAKKCHRTENQQQYQEQTCATLSELHCAVNMNETVGTDTRFSKCGQYEIHTVLHW